MIRVAIQTQRLMETAMLRATSDIVEAVWQAVAGHLPEREEKAHPLGCHRRARPRPGLLRGDPVPPRHGCSWDVAGRLGKGGETTLRRRRDDGSWPGSSRASSPRQLHAYDRVIGLDLSEVAIDGSLHNGALWRRGDRTEPSRSRKDRLEVVDSHRSLSGSRSAGRPTGRTATTRSFCRRHLETLAARGLVEEIETLHLDRGYDNNVVRTHVASIGIDDLVCAREREHQVRQRARRRASARIALAGRADELMAVELRRAQRNTDRFVAQRLAQLALAITFVITIKLVKWADRWNREPST